MKGGPKNGGPKNGGKGGAPGDAKERRLSEAQRAEDHADEAWLAARERGSGPLPHVDPQRAESYQRIEEAIADLPELAPPAGWEAELRAQLAAVERGPAGAAAPVLHGHDGKDGYGEGGDGLDDEPGDDLDAELRRASHGAGGATGVAVESPNEASLIPLSSIPPKKARDTARGSTREMARTPREAAPAVAVPPRDPFPLSVSVAGALTMAAGVLVMAFGVGGGATSEGQRDGSEASASHVDSTHPEQLALTVAGVEPPAAVEPRGVGRDAYQRNLPSSIVAAPGPATRSGVPGAPALGDRFALVLEAPRGELRLYRNHVEVARCPGAAECRVEERGAEQRVSLQYPMDLPGVYRAVYYQGTAMPPRSQGLAEDQRQCRQLAERSPDAARPRCRWQMTVAHEVK